VWCKDRKIWSFKCNKTLKGDPLDFLTTTSTILKRIWPRPQGPSLDFQLMCIYDRANEQMSYCQNVCNNIFLDFRINQTYRRFPELVRHELPIATVDVEREADDARTESRLSRSKSLQRGNTDLTKANITLYKKADFNSEMVKFCKIRRNKKIKLFCKLILKY
jgi:hypothetical protein